MTQLSSSALGILEDCPRCFWLDRNKKIKRPQGIKSGMPVAVDNILKTGLDVLRMNKVLPSVLASDPRLAGYRLYNGEQLPKMRNWKTNPLKMVDAKGNTIVGAFDDLLEHPETETYAYLDYKTTGKEPGQEFGERYYQKQCDIYTCFLLRAKKKIAPFGVLLFFWPVPDEKGGVSFASKAIFLTPNPQAAEDLFVKAVAVLEGPLPSASNDCEYCNTHNVLNLNKF